MKKIVCCSLVILMVFVLETFSYGNVRDQLSSLDKERQTFCLLWISGIEQVAKDTQDSEAKKLMEFFSLNGLLSIPDEEGIKSFKKRDKNELAFFVVQLVPADLNFAYLKPIAEGKTIAAFNSAERVLFFKPRYYSRKWYGLTGLHELHHVVHIPIRKILTIEESANFDLQAYEFEIKLAEKLWPGVFDSTVDLEIARIKSIAEQSSMDLSRQVPRPAIYIETLDQIFGPAVSEDEKHTRMSIIWMAAYLKILSKMEKIDLPLAKRNFMLSLGN